jgi:subtilase family serine protease
MWRLPVRHPRAGPGARLTPDTIGEPGGYDPAELRAYLKLHGTGAGQTVAVTEAFNVRESVLAAVSKYDRWYGLSRPCSHTVTTGCFRLTFTAPQGASTSNGLELSWMAEADLDVEMIHALAPKASIAVVEGHNDTRASMMAAVDYAQSLHPAAISNSWGGAEFRAEHGDNSQCPATGGICVFASGDCGNYVAENCGNGQTPGGYPAADPGVLAVGGTTLSLTPAGRIRSEMAWADSGGGISAYEPRSAYQKAADRYASGRGIPDVSFDADPNSGIAIYVDYVGTYQGKHFQLNQLWAEFGGTSVGAPAWSAILAVADQLRAESAIRPLTIAQLHAAVYAKGVKPVGDITAGANGICGRICTAGPGYDLVTGEGSPRPGIDSYLAGH